MQHRCVHTATDHRDGSEGRIERAVRQEPGDRSLGRSVHRGKQAYRIRSSARDRDNRAHAARGLKHRREAGAGAQWPARISGWAHVESGGVRSERRAIGDHHVVEGRIGGADRGERERGGGGTTDAAAVSEGHTELAPLISGRCDGAGGDDGKRRRLPGNNGLSAWLARDHRRSPSPGGSHKKSRERKQAAGSETTGSARREGGIIHGAKIRKTSWGGENAADEVVLKAPLQS